MTPQKALEQYDDGRTTADGLILAITSSSSKRAVAEALAVLPPEVMTQMQEFVQYYRPRMIIIRGPRPKGATVRFVKDWLVKSKKSRQLVSKAH
jgi:hypothetical protein